MVQPSRSEASLGNRKTTCTWAIEHPDICIGQAGTFMTTARERTSYTRNVINPIFGVHQNRIKPFRNLFSLSLLAGSHVSNIKHIRTIRSAVGILIPKFDFVKNGDHDEGDRDFWRYVVKALSRCQRVLALCNGHLECLVEVFGPVTGDKADEGDRLRWVSCHLDMWLANDWW